LRILTLSDMHCGHIRGLNPKRTIENYYYSNPFQKWVLNIYEDIIKTYKFPDYLILNGDICDGNQSLQAGVEAITTDTDEQINFAIELLKPIIGNNTKVHGIAGSGYHNSSRAGANLDRQVIEKLGGTYHRNIYELLIENEKIQFKHAAGFTLSSLKKEMDNVQKDAVKTKTKCPTMIVRSHGHIFYGIQKSGIQAYITPAFQYSTDYMERKVFNETPDIGAFIIEYDESQKVLYGYPKMYDIPSDIIDEMRELETLTEDRLKEIKKQSEIKKENDTKRFFGFIRNRK